MKGNILKILFEILYYFQTKQSCSRIQCIRRHDRVSTMEQCKRFPKRVALE